MKMQAIPSRPLGVLALCATVSMLTACSTRGIPFLNNTANTQGNRPTASTERVTATKEVIENRVIGTGKIVAKATINVPFLSGGLITAVNIKEGDLVKRGQVIATIDTTDLKRAAETQQLNYLSALATYSQTIKPVSAADVKAAQASLASAQSAYAELGKDPTAASLAALQASLQNAEATLKQSQAAYDRRAGRDPGVAGSSEALALEKATNDLVVAKANYDAKFEKASKSQYASAAAQIAAAQKNLAALEPDPLAGDVAKLKLDQAYRTWQLAIEDAKAGDVLAPIDGLVTVVNFDAGEWAGTGGAFAQIVDYAQPIFDVQLDEIDLGQVKPGQDARVLLQSYPGKTIAAKVDSVSRVGVSSGNSVTYRVSLLLAEGADQPEVLLNMSGTAEIISSKIDEAIVVPTRALIVNTTSKTYSILRINSAGESETVPIQIGARGIDKTQVLSGVAAGDVIAIPAVRTQTTGGAGGPGGGGPPGGGG